MYNRNRYAISARKLFPPVVPNSVPAFIGTNFDALGEERTWRMVFKKSVANFAGIVNNQQDFDAFNQVHISVRSLETNANAINTSIHPTGYMILPLSTEVSLDTPLADIEPGNVYRVYGRDPKTPYVAVLRTLEDSFPKLNKLYKVQVRLGNWKNQDGSTRLPSTLAELSEMERDFNNTSEWSSVSMIKPISEPDYGIYKFKEAYEFSEDEKEKYNTIATANFEYVGFYNMTYDEFEENSGYYTNVTEERITDYWFKLYDATGKKLLSESGLIKLTEHDRKNIGYTFNYLTQDGEKYFVEFGIKTENGFEASKIYPIKAVYIVLEMSNAMVRVSEERDYARMKIEVQAKQVVLEPIMKKNTDELSTLEFVKDIEDPMYAGIPESEQAKIESTHAIVDGSVAASKSFYLQCPKDIWVAEMKVMGLECFETREEAMKNPYMYLENVYLTDANVPYLTQVRLISYKKIIPGLGFTTEIYEDEEGIKHLRQVNNDKEVYIIEAVKQSFSRNNGINKLIAEQSVKKESVQRTKYIWKENVISDPGPTIPGQKPSTEERTFNMMSRWEHVKDVTVKDIVYPLVPGTTNVYMTPLEADAQEINRSINLEPGVSTIPVLTDPKPIDPTQEFYVYLTNYKGGLGLEVLETKIYTTNPDNPFEVIETDYKTNNPVLKNFLLNKKN